jgi:hypothetical protein
MKSFNSRAYKRREILGLAGKVSIASAGAILLGGCKGTTTPEPPPPPPPPPVPVSVLVRFYNHTQGYLGEKIYDGMSDSPLEVRVSDCPDTSTVDLNLIALRTPIKNSWPGAYREFSKTGKLNKTIFPRENNTEYAAFLMNNTNGADYRIFDNATYYRGLYGHGPNATWDREDHDAPPGPDEIPHEAMRQIKDSLILPWVKYMDFTELQPDIRGDFWVGYGDSGSNMLGGFSDICAFVDSRRATDNIIRLRVFIESIVGHITMCYDPGRAAIKYNYITDDNGINAIGIDLLAYSLARDLEYVR